MPEWNEETALSSAWTLRWAKDQPELNEGGTRLAMVGDAAAAALEEIKTITARWHKADDQRAEWMTRALQAEPRVKELKEARKRAYAAIYASVSLRRHPDIVAVHKAMRLPSETIVRVLSSEGEGE